MPKLLHFQVTGETEKFLQELQQTGLSEREVIAKALWLLNMAYKSGRVALLKQSRMQTQEAKYVVDYVFTLGFPELKAEDEESGMEGEQSRLERAAENIERKAQRNMPSIRGQ